MNEMIEDMARLMGSRADAQMVYDLGKHAHDEAFKTLERIANTVDGDTRIFVITLALKLMLMSAKANMALIVEQTKERNRG